MDKEQIEIQTDRFVNNEMSPEERVAFCREMENDKELQKCVALRKLIVEGELMAAEQQARMAMEHSVSAGHRVFRWQTVAACILILLIVGGGIWGHSYKYEVSDIYDTYSFIPSIERSRGESGLSGEVANVNDTILTLYEKTQFESVVNVFQNTSAEIVEQLPVHSSLYAAISFMKIDKPQEAIVVLSHLPDSEYKEDVEWLLLCSYLQAGARKEAMEKAQKIVENKGYYASEAQKLMVALKERNLF